MMSEYARAKREKQLEEELRWLEVEESYVQGTANSIVRKFKPTVSGQGKRNCYYLLKPGAR